VAALFMMSDQVPGNNAKAINGCHNCRFLCSGPLPSAWSGSFGTLRLSNNLLTGTLPDSWASLVYSSIKVDLTSNKLNGSLGSEWNSTFTSSAAINGSMKTLEFKTGWVLIDCMYHQVVCIICDV
jgi:hypothetical protein